MNRPRIPNSLYTETHHLFGAMEKVAAELGGSLDSVKETIRLLPQNLKEAVAFRDALTALWRYDFGDPYTIDDDKQVLFGTDQCPEVRWLYKCVQVMQNVLTNYQLLLFLKRLGDTSKHLEALVECSPLLALRDTASVTYEAPGYSEKRVDFLIHPKVGVPVLIDAKCRIRELIRKLPLNAKPDPSGLFKGLVEKFGEQQPDAQLQGGWVHTVVGYVEDELQAEFESTDSSKLHFAIFACWDEKAYVLARDTATRDRVEQVFDLPQDDTIILKEEPTTK